MASERPQWNRETMSVDDYQQALSAFLQADVPRHEFHPSMQLVALLERLADAEEEVREARAIMLAVACLDAGFDDRHDEWLARTERFHVDVPTGLPGDGEVNDGTR